MSIWLIGYIAGGLLILIGVGAATANEKLDFNIVGMSCFAAIAWPAFAAIGAPFGVAYLLFMLGRYVFTKRKPKPYVYVKPEPVCPKCKQKSEYR